MLKKAIDRYFYNFTTYELRLMNKKVISSDITYNSLLYLDMIAYQEQCTASWLADRLQISKSAVTVKLNELIHQGLIRKVQKETDKRVYYLELTQEAARLYQIYNKGQYHAIDTVQKQYSKDEIAVFCRVLNSLNDSYCKELQHEYQTD